MDKNRERLLKQFISETKIVISDLTLLNQAFFHSSYINECFSEACDNEKLEFLGDSVLSLVTVDFLFTNYKDKSEGELSRLKSQLVSTSTLCQFAKILNISKYLLLGKGEHKCGGEKRPTLLADTFEAILGAIYLDSGIKSVKEFIIPFLRDYTERIERHNYERDYKTVFQLWIQQEYKTVPVYKTVKETGPDHSKTFYINVYVNDNLCGTGKGKSKKIAQQEAAKSAMEKLSLE